MMRNTGMTTELFWLAMTVSLTGLMWVPYIIRRVTEKGMLQVLVCPQVDKSTTSAWSQRMMMAHQNAIENLALFAPLVLMLHVTGMNTAYTATACAVYFYTRLAHYLVYSLGIPVLRTPVFAVSFGALVALALTLFGLI